MRAVAAGETVLVTDRGRIVAELIAPRVHPDASPVEQRLGELMRQGLLAPARATPATPLPPRRPVAGLAGLLQELDAARSER